MATKPITGYKSVGIKKEEIKKTPPPAGQQYVQQPNGSYKSFAIPGGVNPAPTAPKPQAGVFTNKATGVQTDAKGNPITQPIPFEAPQQTTAQKAESLIRNDQADLNDYSSELGFEKDLFPTGIQGMVDEVANQQKQKMEQAQQQVTEAQRADEFNTGEFKRSGETQIEGIKSMYAQGREGAMSVTNPMVSEKATGILKGRIDDAISRKDQANIDRQNALNDLRIAQKQGRRDAVQSAQDALNRAEQTIQQAETDLLNAETAASEEFRAGATALSNIGKTQADILAQQAETQRQGITTFSSLIESGTELTPQAIKSLSTQLGLDFETAFDFYSGAQAIRDEKGLSNEEKQVQIAQLNQDLQDQQAGLTTEAAKNTQAYVNLVKSGADQETLSAFKELAGITDMNDPFVQLDLEKKKLENNILDRQSQGLPVTIDDYATYFDIIEQQNELNGSGGQALVPTGSLEGITTSFEGGKLNITQEGGLKPYQCGAWVNRVWGLASGSGGGMGNSYQSKLDLVNNRGIAIGELNNFNFAQMIKPGMAFVSEAGATGHTGIVTMVDPAGKMFKTMEANVGDSNYAVGDPPIEKTHFLNENGLKGFVYPPNYNAVGTSQTADEDFKVALNSISFGSVSAKDTANEVLNGLLEKGDTKKAQQFIITQTRNNATATQQDVLDGKLNTIDALNRIKTKLSEFEEKGGDTGIFTGVKESTLQKGGLTSDPELAGVANDIALAIVDYRRAVSGAAFTESEGKAYDSIFPSTGKTSELNIAKIDSILEKLDSDTNAFYKRRIGPEIYDSIFATTQSTPEAVTTTQSPAKDYAASYKNYINEAVTDEQAGLDDDAFSELDSIFN